MPHPLRSSRRGFTMKELLVVILLVASTAAAPKALTTGSAKKASSDAMTRSHMFATRQPPPMQAPCTSAMTGLGASQMRRPYS